MRSPAPADRRAAPAASLIAILAVAACGGGGGGGGGPVGPDVTPPGVPVASLIVVEPPLPGTTARLSGQGGSVEANATVRVSNSTAEDRIGQPVTSSTTAAGNGAFTVSVPAQLGDRLELTAADAAGNVSGALPLQAGPVPTTVTAVDPGDDHFLTLTTGEGAFNLPFAAGSERYTLVVQSLNPVASVFPLTIAGTSVAEIRGLDPSAAATPTPAGLEGRIREFEREAMPLLPRDHVGRRGLAPADDPPLGSIRGFHVVNRLIVTVPQLSNPANFDEVDARLRYKGDHTLIYVDLRAEGPNIPDALIEEVGDRFDEQTYDTDRAAFGAETDIDGNGRIIVLMTPTVNALNTQATVDAGGVLSGFFFGIDLQFDPVINPFANDAEIFYSVVPDPGKVFSPALIGTVGFAAFLDGILAHEFEHMINAGRRLAKGALPEVVWLDEGLAHYAETLNGVTFQGTPDLQNSLRSALWLQKPYAQSLVSGTDNLEQRGAAWLLVAYLVDQHGQGVLRDLVEGPFTGIPNVENAADTSFPFLFYRFTAALLLDGQGLSSDPLFDIPSLDLRQRFQAAKQFWAGTSPPRLPGSFLGIRTSTVPGSLSAAGVTLSGGSPAYFEVNASGPGTHPVVVRADRQSNLQVTIIRTR
jgi:hypothetical protein